MPLFEKLAQVPLIGVDPAFANVGVTFQYCFAKSARPIADASVTAILEVEGHPQGERLEPSQKTDAEGRFFFDRLPNENIELTVRARGYRQVRADGQGPFGYGRQSMSIADGVKEVQVELMPAGYVAGRVVDAASGLLLDSFTVRFIHPILQPGECLAGGYSSDWGNGRLFHGTDGYWDTTSEDLEVGCVCGLEFLAEGYQTLSAQRLVVEE